MKNKWRLVLLSLLPAVGLFLYSIPVVKERVDWRVMEWRAEVQYFLYPPEQVVFQPNPQVETAAPTTGATQAAPIPALPTASPTPGPTAAVIVTVLPTITPTPLPGSVQLSGVRYERQGWNNCGPATLAMALSYWGWEGDQYSITPYTKPNDRDKNVMPYEMVNYVNTNTDLRSISRLAGNLELLKRLIGAGFPVIIEKGFEGPDFDGWMGHYVLVTGYDDTAAVLTTQDSYMGPELQVPYAVVESYWRAFNGTYLVVFPVSREQEVLDLLGEDAQEIHNRQHAAQNALEEISRLSGRDQFFALFNRGSSLVTLLEFREAAAAYDQAFALYAALPTKERPWRMMWYQTGPYWAYYYSGRYQDVIDLATKTLGNMSEPVLEESYYWRGMAFEATGNRQKAIRDFQMSLKLHPGFQPAVDQLSQLEGQLDPNQ